MDRLVEIGHGFWNIRGSFKVGGVLDVGTHMSLVRLRSGDFALLDAYTLTGDVQRQVLALTDQGRAVRAILHLHPFHTVHVERCAAQFPGAELYGTRRHKTLAPSLRWQDAETDSPALQERFADDLVFTVPRGVEFIPRNQHLHFASVLAMHPASQALHVDDTLSWTALLGMQRLSLHPTLRFKLEPRAGAGADFRAWGQELTALCEGVQHLCTAHGKALPPQPMPAPGVAARVQEALARVEHVLARHARKYG